jgi:hypothetical protein
MEEVKSMRPRVWLRFAFAALIACGVSAGTDAVDATPSDDPCSVTLRVQGMMKSRSGAT